MITSEQLLVLTGETLSINDIVDVARHKRMKVIISEETKSKMQASRDYVAKVANEKRVVYGITTGFGKFKNVVIAQDQLCQMQENLIMSHAVGVGEPLKEEEVRAAVLVRANSLVKGYSGVRIELVEKLLELVNADIYPYVPCKGSVGSSGDLAPLSHIMLVILGMGEVIEGGQRKPSNEVLARLGIQPIKLVAKEGLALINGTSVMTGIAALAIFDAELLTQMADISGAMTLEATMGTVAACHHMVHLARPHIGQQTVAENIRRLCADSAIGYSHRNCDRVQDAYSLRCMPQVHGAVRDSLRHIRSVVEIELNSATDNPLIFHDYDLIISCGNFHGEPIAFVMDYLGIVIAELGNIAERRICRMVDPATSEGLPAFLIPHEQAGLSSGYMISHYTAAAVVSENKILAHPASVDSIPTSANQEDHVSFGTIAARKARQIIENVYEVIGIELMSAAQGLDFHKPLLPGLGCQAAWEMIRQFVPFSEKDKILYQDMQTIRKEIMLDGKIVQHVEQRIGKLS